MFTCDECGDIIVSGARDVQGIKDNSDVRAVTELVMAALKWTRVEFEESALEERHNCTSCANMFNDDGKTQAA